MGEMIGGKYYETPEKPEALEVLEQPDPPVIISIAGKSIENKTIREVSINIYFE